MNEPIDWLLSSQPWVQYRARVDLLGQTECSKEVNAAPLIWYDILHVTEVLAQCEWLRTGKRLNEMVSIVKAKADDQGRFKPESIWQAWREWDFGQKREPSAWLTLMVWRMLRRTV